MIHVMQFQISEAPQLFLYWPMCPSHVPFSTSCPCSKRTTMHGSAAMGGKRERTCSSQRRIGAGGLLGPARSHGMRGAPGGLAPSAGPQHAPTPTGFPPGPTARIRPRNPPAPAVWPNAPPAPYSRTPRTAPAHGAMRLVRVLGGRTRLLTHPSLPGARLALRRRLPAPPPLCPAPPPLRPREREPQAVILPVPRPSGFNHDQIKFGTRISPKVAKPSNQPKQCTVQWISQ